MIGDIVSHINVDAEVLTEGSWYIQVLFMTWTFLGLGAYFLYVQLRWVAFVGLGYILLVLIGTQGFNSKAMGKEYGARLKELDGRTTLADEAVTNIKLVKFSAWESPLMDRIMDLRRKELRHLNEMANIYSRSFQSSSRWNTFIDVRSLYDQDSYTDCFDGVCDVDDIRFALCSYRTSWICVDLGVECREEWRED